ncbi:FadR/GntR family transcriptional regulator [Roseiarcus sp.]|uniref:FadR/GntR family transcriptional regulator n=1 Tax=Roseiarcus sp. TaxID=1969460 RepID=UPI003F99BE66
MDRAKAEEDYLRVRHYLLDTIKGEQLPTGRLPTERRLAEQFTVGRAIARRALSELETEGLVYRHVGRGTFVGSRTGKPQASVRSSREYGPAEYIEARLRFEPELAWIIVVNATAADLEALRELLQQCEKADTGAKFELCDADFHEALAKATHNSVAIDMYRVINGIRRRERSNWTRIYASDQTPEQRKLFIEEHNAILEALAVRDGRAARDAWSSHIRNTKRRLLDL